MKGFTLIELLVVVLIMGILAVVAVPQYQLTVRKTKAAIAWAFLEDVMKAQSLYFLANGQYALSLADLDIVPPKKITPYTFEMVAEGFMIRANGGGSDGNFPHLEAFGAHPKTHYNHLLNERYCIGGSANAAAVCRALGATQGPNDASYRFHLPKNVK